MRYEGERINGVNCKVLQSRNGNMGLLESTTYLLTIIAIAYGIDSWRREFKGKKQIELAEDTLATFYEAVDAIKNIRHPGSSSSETEMVKRENNETEEQFRARKKASLVFRRYEDYQELFSKLHSMRYRFMAQIGKKEAKPFEDLRKIVNKIFISASILSEIWSKDCNLDEGCWKQKRKQEAIFWDSFQENDPINSELKTIISEIENTCQNVISQERNPIKIAYKNWQEKTKKNNKSKR